jgi:ABC-2 type transport system permease protein
MTAGTAPGPAPAAVVLTRESALGRFYGFGSVYAKTLRDSRFSFMVVAGLVAGILLAAGAAIPTVFPTEEARQEIVRIANQLSGAAQGLAGKPVNVGTLGGYLQYKYGPILLVITAIWSIMALSGTLALEARRGSLEFLAATSFARRRIAVEKVAAHLTVLAVTTVIVTVVAWLVGAAFGSIAGDAIPVQAALGYGLWLAVMTLWFGGLAFALSPVLGRSLGAGVAGAALLAGYIASNYAASIPAFGVVAIVTPWYWTSDHLPLAGQYDWATLVPVAIFAVGFLAIGVEAFARRDLGTTSRVRLPSMPAFLLGEEGPVARSFGERLPMALGWGIGLGIFGLAIATLSAALADSIRESPDLVDLLAKVFPGVDIATAGGFLQLVFIELGFIVVGFAAATLVGGWASDETSGRLEVVLASPMARRTWLLRSGLGVFIAIGLMTVVVALGIGVGALTSGSDAVTPMLGTVVMGLYAVALAGIGFAVGGVFRASIAAEIVAAVVVTTYVIDLLAPALRLPDAIHQLALTTHLGQPMIGAWDWAGMVACVAIAIVGIALGAWGITRRDLNG